MDIKYSLKLKNKTLLGEYIKILDDKDYVPMLNLVTTDSINCLDEKTGTGLKEEKKTKRRKVRLINGKGAITEIEENTTTNRAHNNGKYIELNKLKQDNVISLKYASTNTSLKTPVHVNNDVKTVILNIIDNQFNKTLYSKLKQSDKVIIDQFVKTMKQDVDANDGVLEIQRQYEILCGELQAGNDSKLIKDKLKQYILMGMSEGLILKPEGHSIIFQLNI